MSNNPLRKQVHSPLYIYNLFNRTYFKYFHGHPVSSAKAITDDRVRCYIERFIGDDYAKLDKSETRLEEYLLWLFSRNGKQPIVMMHVGIDAYLKEIKTTGEVTSFSHIIKKYMRENKIETWSDYIEPKYGFYPKIIQHYMKDKSIPFEFILYLGVIDRLPDRQKKSIKALLRKELYSIVDRMKVMEKNRAFFDMEVNICMK